jgi:hypothetical protein
VHAHSDRGPVGAHVAAEDLADADLGRAIGLVPVAPLRQVMRDPATAVQGVAVEGVLELDPATG